MTSKQKFIKVVEEMLKEYSEPVEEEVYEFLEKLKNSEVKASAPVTKSGIPVLKFLQDNPDGIFSAKSIGEQIGISSRSVSGTMRKLVSDGLVEKRGANPISYIITEVGKEFDLDNIENL